MPVICVCGPEDVERVRAGIRLRASALGSGSGAGPVLVSSCSGRKHCVTSIAMQHMSGIDLDPHWDWKPTANSRTSTFEVPILPGCCVQGSCSRPMPIQSHANPDLATYLAYPGPKLDTRELSAVFWSLGHLTTRLRLPRSLNPVHTGVGPLNLPGLSHSPPVYLSPVFK